MIVSKQNLTGKLTNKQLIQGVINKATEIIEVYPEIQTKIVTPTKQIQTVLPDENVYALSQVTVNPIPNNYIVPQGQKEITENGIYNVTTYETANVEIEMGKLTNEEYAEANDDLDDILEGSTPATIYPPDWSELGYEDTPKNILDDFDYSKDIKDNWDSSVTNLSNKFNQDKNLIYMPIVDTSNATNMSGFFSGCSNLKGLPLLNTGNVTNMQSMLSGCLAIEEIPLFDTSKVTSMFSTFSQCENIKSIPQFDTKNVTNMFVMFQGCKNLEDFPVLNANKVTNFMNMFSQCIKLTNDSLNNIMASCLTAISYTGTKTLKQLGLSSAQATTCQSLSNYQAFLDAGWTTGY